MPASCEVNNDDKDVYGIPEITCAFIGGDYNEWVAELNKPFQSKGGCELA